jgi:hypothetical protein
MKKTVLIIAMISIATTSLYAQIWTTPSSSNAETVTGISHVGIGTSTTVPITDELSVNGNLSLVRSSGNASDYRLIRGGSATGAIGFYANTGISDGAGVTVSGINESFVPGSVRFSAVPSGGSNDVAFYFFLLNSGVTDLMKIYKNGITTINGKLAVGTGSTTLGTDTKLAVEGLISCRELRVIPTGTAWPDYVFKKDYNRMSLADIEQYIGINSHLPQLPPAAEIEKNGYKIGETQTQVLQALEELYLHVIDLKKENEQLKNRIQVLEKN